MVNPHWTGEMYKIIICKNWFILYCVNYVLLLQINSKITLYILRHDLKGANLVESSYKSFIDRRGWDAKTFHVKSFE